MKLTSAASSVVTPEVTPRRDTFFDLVRWSMLAVWIALAIVVVAAGSRLSSLGALESDLGGGVTHISVTAGMPDDAQGSQLQTIWWQSGLLRYQAQVTMVSPGAESLSVNAAIPTRTGTDIASLLATEHPGLAVTHVAAPTGWASVYDFRIPSWAIWLALVGSIGTLMVLVSGPEPWRATRWAWFWLMTTVIGPPLFLILAGPTPPLRAPARRRRLHGGWALVISLIVGSVLGSMFSR